MVDIDVEPVGESANVPERTAVIQLFCTIFMQLVFPGKLEVNKTEIKTASDKNFQPPIVASFNLSPLIRVKATPPYELRYAHHDSRF